MEELRKLEKVQRMVQFMESKGLLTSTSSNSNRFVANLMLLFLEPCGEIGINEKCCLVSDLMSSLSSTFLEEASIWLSHDFVPKEENSGFQQNVVGNALLSCDQMKENSLLQSYNENMAMVGLESMQKANSTLEDFILFYVSWIGCKQATINFQILTYSFIHRELYLSGTPRS